MEHGKSPVGIRKIWRCSHSDDPVCTEERKPLPVRRKRKILDPEISCISPHYLLGGHVPKLRRSRIPRAREIRIASAEYPTITREAYLGIEDLDRVRISMKERAV